MQFAKFFLEKRLSLLCTCWCDYFLNFPNYFFVYFLSRSLHLWKLNYYKYIRCHLQKDTRFPSLSPFVCLLFECRLITLMLSERDSDAMIDSLFSFISFMLNYIFIINMTKSCFWRIFSAQNLSRSLLLPERQPLAVAML